jgi:hypothetical protein
MKNKIKYSAIALITGVAVIGTISCTKHDQVINQNPATTNSNTSAATTTQNDTLTSYKISSTLINGNLSGAVDVGGALGFIWNGSLDPQWSKAQSITTTNTVPDLGNNTFEGFIGNTVNVTVRSLWSDSCVYFLFEWPAAFQSIYSSPWYFNPKVITVSGHHLMEWAQMGAAPIWDYHGNMVSPSFPQDEFVIMFNIANSCYEFNSQSCYGVCHTYPPTVTLDTVNYQIISTYGAGGGMFTNMSNEKCDIWRARTVQTLNANQANDCFLWYDNGNISKNAVTSDTDVSAAGVSNKQTLTINGLTLKETVPMWIKVTGGSAGLNTPTNLIVSDTNTPGYVYVAQVDSNGVLYCSANKATRATITYTITPNATYETTGTGPSMTLGANCIPGTIVGPYTGDEADVRANMYWTGSGYELLLKRELKTADKYLEDVDFTPFSSNPGSCIPFGYGIMFNGADNEHAIATGLQLRFSTQSPTTASLMPKKGGNNNSMQQLINKANKTATKSN